MNTVLEHRTWRYATKKFDATKKVSNQDLETLMEAARLSASSYGLQPYHFFVISDPEIREQLKPASWGQSQITDASHIIVFANATDFGEELVEHKSNWTARQAYIAFGNLMQAAAELKIDTCPMEGFESKKYNEILGLEDKNLNAAVVLAVGYRSEEDETQHYAKVRKSTEELFTLI